MPLDTSKLGAWSDLAFFEDSLAGVEAQLLADKRPAFPPDPLVFAALEQTQPDNVKVVILGQDPYPTYGHANGLAFSVTPDVSPLPRSLRNIFRELKDDVGGAPPTGDLGAWARQGVLLLNTALTVPEGTAGGHAGLGWSLLTAEVLRKLDDVPRAFLLWGRHAQAQKTHLSKTHHLIVETPHPSPLSASKGFFGSRPFSRVNAWLMAYDNDPIDWTAG